MRSPRALLGCAAALILSDPAGAQAPGPESRFIATFTALCLEHMGDAAGQTSAARGTPWNFVPDGPATDAGLTPYRYGSSRLAISEPMASCALTDELDPRVTLASVVSAMTAAIGTDEGRPLEEADSRYWLIAGPGNEEYVIALKVSGATGRNLATLWVQRRATLRH